MKNTTTRVFLAIGPGELNKTKSTEFSEVTDLAAVLQELDTMFLAGGSQPEEPAQQVVRGPSLQDAELLNKCMLEKNYVGRVVDLSSKPKSGYAESLDPGPTGRFLCIDQYGDRLTILPVGSAGWLLKNPRYVYLGADTEVVDLEKGDEEWELAYDRLTYYMGQCVDYLRSVLQTSEPAPLPSGVYRSADLQERIFDVMDDLQEACYTHKLLVTCE